MSGAADLNFISDRFFTTNRGRFLFDLYDISGNHIKSIPFPQYLNNSHKTLLTDDKLLVVSNGDQNGEFVERWQVSEEGNLLASEAVDITQPFIVNNETYQVTELNPLGSYMKVKQVDIKEGVAEGFTVSKITTVDMNGNIQELHSFIDLDKPVLLEFWSTSCPFSERVRPDLNELYELYGENFTLLSSPRETNKQLIDDHLGEHPKNGILLAHDESVWQQFNPLPVSPLFYLIDSDGTIKMKAAGANSIEPLKIKLSQVITNSK